LATSTKIKSAGMGLDDGGDDDDRRDDDGVVVCMLYAEA
jgi:hypothetical protein